MPRIMLLSCSLLLGLTPWSAVAEDLEVAADGSAEYGSVTEALAAAVSGDVVLLAAGTYGPDSTGEVLPLDIPPGVTVQGAGAATTHIDGLYTSSLVHVDWTEGDPAVITDLTLTGGEAELDGDGDALYLWQAEVRLERVVLQENGDPEIPDRPWNVDSWVDVRTSTLELMDVTVVDNHGSHDGMRCEHGAIHLDRVTFEDNYVYYSLLDLRDECDGSLVDVRALDNAGSNCDGALFALGAAGGANVELAGNDAGPCRLWQGGDLVHAAVVDNRTHGPFALVETLRLGNSVVAFNTGSVQIVEGGEARFNDVFGNEPADWLGDDPTGSDGNRAADPRFVSVEAKTRDLRLADDSPLIDGGGDELTWPADIDGVVRPVDGDGDGVALPDPGAHEHAMVEPGDDDDSAADVDDDDSSDPTGGCGGCTTASRDHGAAALLLLLVWAGRRRGITSARSRRMVLR